MAGGLRLAQILPGTSRYSCALFAVPDDGQIEAVLLDTSAFYLFVQPPPGADGTTIAFQVA